ncbi:MAG TPA: coenzyme F420-0:L-glutamate ligase [Candidatus Paceibacterota bacterium]|nr:coenzyme F420-0:L-glutamate ligase [Candidatus Paceibacterota bacterium]
MQVKPIKTRVFREGEDLVAFIRSYVKKLPERSVLVVTSKIVALAERRTAVRKDLRTKEQLIRKESDFAFPTKWVWLTLKDGLVVASAGIDESNADGKFILLPRNSYRSAAQLRKRLMKLYRVKELGVIIPDSRTVPLRAGALGMAIGYAGMKGLRDYRGAEDIFGRAFKFERSAVADSLATAATLSMGEGAERCPLAVVTGAPVEFTDRVDPSELVIPLQDDMYLPFISRIPKTLIRKRHR